MVYRDLVVYIKSLNMASIAANTSAPQNFTVSGLDASRDVVLNFYSTDPVNGIGGAALSNAFAIADNTLSVTFVNPTGSAIDKDASNFVLVVGRTRTDPSADGDRL
jgi:hypothetical protein